MTSDELREDQLRAEADTAIQQAENWAEEFAALQTRIRGYAKEREATGGTIDSSRVAADLLRIVGGE